MGENNFITRRVFLKATAGSVVAVGTLPLWFGDPIALAAQEDKLLNSLISQADLEKIIKVALEKGGDFAEVYIEKRVSTDITLEDDKIKSLNYGIIMGAGVRVISGDTTGYAYSDDLTFEKLQEAAQTASLISDTGTGINKLNLTTRKTPNYFDISDPVSSYPESDKIELVFRANQGAHDYDKRIEKVTVLYLDEDKSILIANSEGILVEDKQNIVRLAIMPLAIEGSKRQQGWATGGGRVNKDYFQKNLPEKFGEAAASRAISMLDAREAPGGLHPVVIASGWGGVLVHEAFGHSLEADGIRKKTSLMAEQSGKPVASSVVTIIDDATVPSGRGSYNIDDEGTSGQKKVLVEKGILKGFLYDKLNAKLMSTQSTGNGRRSSYRDYPIPRMSNIFLAQGDAPFEDIIKSIKKGVYAKQMAGGSVDTTSGNFNFQVREAYLIEEGKITFPLKGVVLIGNGLEAMKKVELVGNDLVVDQTTGSCGKDGQWVYSGVGQPTVKFSEITVGGTKIS